MKENWQKENLEKSKEALKDHFERKSLERMWKEMAISPKPRPHYSTIGREIDESEFDDDLKEFFDKLIWDDKIEKKSLLEK